MFKKVNYYLILFLCCCFPIFSQEQEDDSWPILVKQIDHENFSIQFPGEPKIMKFDNFISFISKQDDVQYSLYVCPKEKDREKIFQEEIELINNQKFLECFDVKSGENSISFTYKDS